MRKPETDNKLVDHMAGGLCNRKLCCDTRFSGDGESIWVEWLLSRFREFLYYFHKILHINYVFLDIICSTCYSFIDEDVQYLNEFWTILSFHSICSLEQYAEQ